MKNRLTATDAFYTGCKALKYLPQDHSYTSLIDDTGEEIDGYNTNVIATRRNPSKLKIHYKNKLKISYSALLLSQQLLLVLMIITSVLLGVFRKDSLMTVSFMCLLSILFSFVVCSIFIKAEYSDSFKKLKDITDSRNAIFYQTLEKAMVNDTRANMSESDIKKALFKCWRNATSINLNVGTLSIYSILNIGLNITAACVFYNTNTVYALLVVGVFLFIAIALSALFYALLPITTKFGKNNITVTTSEITEPAERLAYLDILFWFTNNRNLSILMTYLTLLDKWVVYKSGNKLDPIVYDNEVCHSTKYASFLIAKKGLCVLDVHRKRYNYTMLDDILISLGDNNIPIDQNYINNVSDTIKKYTYEVSLITDFARRKIDSYWHIINNQANRLDLSTVLSGLTETLAVLEQISDETTFILNNAPRYILDLKQDIINSSDETLKEYTEGMCMYKTRAKINTGCLLAFIDPNDYNGYNTLLAPKK